MSTKINKIGPEELAFIDGFCKKKDVELVDLRIELVDHLAELTLKKMEENPTISFKDAFFLVYKSFGIFGFMDIAAQHQAQMQKRYWREIWQYTKSWITPPRVIATAFFSWLTYVTLQNLPAVLPTMPYVFIGIFLISGLLSAWQFRRNKQVLKGEKSVLMSGSGMGYYTFFYLVLYIPYLSVGKDATLFLNVGVLTFYFVLTILFCLANYFLQEKAHHQLEELKTQMNFG